MSSCWAFCGTITRKYSLGDKRTLLTPFSLVLPRVINAPMALMTTPQNLQGSPVLGWHHRVICFPIGPCTFLHASAKPWGRSFVCLSGALLGLPRFLLVCIAFPFHFSLWSVLEVSVSLIHSVFFVFVFFATLLQMMALFLWHFVAAADTFNDFSA